MRKGILGLDLGTKMGWAYAEGSTILQSGQKDFGNTKGYDGFKYRRFRNWLIDWGGHLEAIVYEKVMAHTGPINPKTGQRSFNVLAAHNYGAFEGYLQEFIADWNIPLIGIHVGTLKKDFVGNGRATKFDVCRECHKRGWEGGQIGTAKNDNEADARALLHVHLAKQYGDMLLV